MMEEYDLVVLTHDFEELELKSGDVGTVVLDHKENKAFEVEFATADGRTVAVLTLTVEDVRPMRQKEILHVREYAPA